MFGQVSAMDAVESAELEALIDSLGRKVELQKGNELTGATSIGDLNDYAFLKPAAPLARVETQPSKPPVLAPS